MKNHPIPYLFLNAKRAALLSAVSLLLAGVAVGAQGVDWSGLAAGQTPSKDTFFIKRIFNFESPNICQIADAQSTPPNPFPGLAQCLYVKASGGSDASEIKSTIVQFALFQDQAPANGAVEMQFFLPADDKNGIRVDLGGTPDMKAKQLYAGIRLLGGSKVRVYSEGAGDSGTICDASVAVNEVQTLRVEWSLLGDKRGVRYSLNGVPIAPSGSSTAEPHTFPLSADAMAGAFGTLFRFVASPPPAAYFIGRISAERLAD